jgi:hypothetical protein
VVGGGGHLAGMLFQIPPDFLLLIFTDSKYITRRIFPFRDKPTSEQRVPPKCSLSEADYESDIVLVRLDTTWIEAYQTSLPQIILQSTRRIYHNPITNKILQFFAND